VTRLENRASRKSIHEGTDWCQQSSTGHQTGEARGIRGNEGKRMADKEADDSRGKERAIGERDLIMAETAGEIDIAVAAAASNHLSSPAQLRRVSPFDHGGHADTSGMKTRFVNVARAARGKRMNRNQPFSIRD